MLEATSNVGHPALTDAQTGLPNRLHWDTVFGVVFAAGERGIPVTLILMEVRDYQAWLRNTAALEADRTLGFLGQAIRSTIRQSDLLARIHEDRFAFFLLDCNLAGGRLVTDRLDEVIDPVRRVSGLSFNMGVAAFTREMKARADLVEAAEGALRAAQARGKNAIEFQV